MAYLQISVKRHLHWRPLNGNLGNFITSGYSDSPQKVVAARSRKCPDFLLDDLSRDRGKAAARCPAWLRTPPGRNAARHRVLPPFAPTLFLLHFQRPYVMGSCWRSFNCYFWHWIEWRVFRSHLGWLQMLQINKAVIECSSFHGDCLTLAKIIEARLKTCKYYNIKAEPLL